MSPYYLWHYDIDENQFLAMLNGELIIGRLDSDWAATRLLDYAAYPEIVRLIGFRRLVNNWPRWREKIRSESRKRGFDFLVSWLPQHRPDLI